MSIILELYQILHRYIKKNIEEQKKNRGKIREKCEKIRGSKAKEYYTSN